jgi:acyl CoA:acetate/3-ketoacid CoA transferase alpha subunit
MDKVVRSAADAVADIGDGSSLAVGGFGLCGIPMVLLRHCEQGRRTSPVCPTTAASTTGAWRLSLHGRCGG